MTKNIIDFMNSVITAKGKVTLKYEKDGKLFNCDVELTGKASDVFTIDNDLNLRLISDGTVLGNYYNENDLRLVLEEMKDDFKAGRKEYYFDSADVVSEWAREEKIWANVINHLIKTFNIDYDTARSMTQTMLENADIDNFSEWENK